MELKIEFTGEVGLRGFGRAQNFLAGHLLSQKKIPNDKSRLISHVTHNCHSESVSPLANPASGKAI